MAVTQLKNCVELPLNNEDLSEIIDKAKDYALMHGMTMHSNNPFNRNFVRISRFTLLPTSFPEKEFLKAKNIQITLNNLIHKVAYDHDFLTSTLQSTIKADEFTRKLYNIYKTVHKEGYTQTNSVGLMRSDYLLNGDMKIKQVEFNTISSSFGGLAPITAKLHKYILTELGHSDKTINIPENKSINGLAKGLIEAWKLYKNKEAVILFIVEENTSNICDQRAFDYVIHEVNPQIKIIRRTFKEIIKQAQLRPNKELIVGKYLVAVVYYRTGYEAAAYTSEDVWSVRLLIEQSKALKCPSIQYQLAGTKKVQQVLAQPGVLRRFLNEDEATRVREVFTGLYSLDFDELGEQAIEMAIMEPKKFVMKPQREGGGNNIYGDEIRSKLEAIRNSRDRDAYILMEYIDAPLQDNYLLGPNDQEPQIQSLISELGIYGIIIGDQNHVSVNEQVGHVIRSKPFGEDEGGIIAGAGALDSPYLVK
ncbi:glutathione synthetase-like [Chelonus insularis]|uniref:glutathione synthetase-like n=1 Tax=Chelonus insularis TaxID=460826 RepID=UPI00158AA74B|nr:glutathione synthetase-like [Chelonus insularis]XP_034942816.1 glutathione synthetase-like [Chelonus insularis]XP_034942817.1 glutathione synthetase-like [Chelonus insularis]XP_034942818.1 glutathione synthetase-like [Chelonus insularis]